jgi:hypothetical protein
MSMPTSEPEFPKKEFNHDEIARDTLQKAHTYDSTFEYIKSIDRKYSDETRAFLDSIAQIYDQVDVVFGEADPGMPEGTSFMMGSFLAIATLEELTNSYGLNVETILNDWSDSQGCIPNISPEYFTSLDVAQIAEQIRRAVLNVSKKRQSILEEQYTQMLGEAFEILKTEGVLAPEQVESFYEGFSFVLIGVRDYILLEQYDNGDTEESEVHVGDPELWAFMDKEQL